MDFEIINLTKENCDAWDTFCLDNSEAWFWHTVPWIEYSLIYRPELKSTSFSFLIKDDRGIVAVCPLLMEETARGGLKAREFSNVGGGAYGIVPALRDGLGEKYREKLLRSIFCYIDELADRNAVKKALFRFTRMAMPCLKYNYLMKFGFIDASLNTQVIDLTASPDELMADVRKGHKYDIKRGEKAYAVEIYDKDSLKKEVFEQYRLLHHKAAGRVTRPQKTFDMMYNWVASGKAILVGAQDKKGNTIGFAFVVVFKNGACYGSASDDPEADTSIPISHVIQWRIIEWLTSRKIKVYEVGSQQFGAQVFDHPSEKDLDISLFKRGFGGETVALFRGVKYYDKEYMQRDLKENVCKLIEGTRWEANT